MTDIILETVRAVVLLGIVIFLWTSRSSQSQPGWRFILFGFGLLMFGSLLDISDNFEELNPYIVIGDTEVEAFLEKFVGFLGGFIFLAVGLVKWVPNVQRLSNLADIHNDDLNEIKKSLEASRVTLEALADNLPIFISLKDHEGRFQFVNKCFKEWVCVTDEEILGKSVYDIYPKEQADVFAAYDKDVISSGVSHSREVDLSYPDGQIRTVITTRFPLLSPTGEVNGLGNFNFDITEIKRAGKLKQEFLSTVSHELRTPLTSIKGAIGLVMSGASGEISVEAQSMLDIAYTNSDRLMVLINDILDMDKIESGQLDYDMKTVKVGELIDEAVSANEGYGDQYKITFVKTETDDTISVLGDRERLIQVLSNLMSNAAKFSPDGDQVELSATRSGETVRIAVKDNGPGVPEGFKGKIFEKFTQADSSDTRQEGGTGLGLSIAKAIVENHGGKIDFSSDADTGTTFFFTLPVTE